MEQLLPIQAFFAAKKQQSNKVFTDFLRGLASDVLSIAFSQGPMASATEARGASIKASAARGTFSQLLSLVLAARGR
jgi:hypothetical protein